MKKHPAGFNDVSYMVCLGLSHAYEQSLLALQKLGRCIGYVSAHLT